MKNYLLSVNELIYALAQARRSDSPFGRWLNRRNHSRSRGRCGFEPPQPLLVERENRRGAAEIHPDRAAARRHFALRLEEDVEHLLAGVLGGEILRVVAQENQAGDVFERLRLGVVAQLLLTRQAPTRAITASS